MNFLKKFLDGNEIKQGKKEEVHIPLHFLILKKRAGPSDNDYQRQLKKIISQPRAGLNDNDYQFQVKMIIINK